MGKKRIIWITLAFCTALGVYLFGRPRTTASDGQTAAREPLPAVTLFAGDLVSGGGKFSEASISKQHKHIEVEPSAMEALANGADRVRLQLLDGQEYTVVITRRDDGPVASMTMGELAEVPGSRVILSTAKGEDGSRKVSGKFTMPDGRVFQLTPTAGGHCLFELDSEAVRVVCEPAAVSGPEGQYRAKGEVIQLAKQQLVMPATPHTSLASQVYGFDGTAHSRRVLRGSPLFTPPSTLPVNPSNTGASNPLSENPERPESGRPGPGLSEPPTTEPPSGGSSSTIDIVVMYTPAAAQAKGGDAGIMAHIGSAVADVNAAFMASQIGATVRLVGTGQLNYNSQGSLSGALEKLRNDEGAESLRVSKKADLLAVMMTGDSGGSTGLGAVMPSEKGNASACYSAVHEAYAISNHSFAHELGHNLGSQHCWDQTGEGVNAYAHGHRWTGSDDKGYRSIMSYSKDGDRRVGYFSNPKVNHQGQPTGDASKADNARTFGVTVPVVSQYK